VQQAQGGLLLCRLTNKSSSFIHYQQFFRLKNNNQLFVVNFNFSFSIGLRLRAERSMNTGTAASPTVVRNSPFFGDRK
jgi:hypothetical protein